MNLKVVIFLLGASTVSGFYIDSMILGKYAVPVLMQLGAMSTYKAGKLLAFLTNKPRTSKVIHVVPEPEPYGGTKNSVHITESKPYHWDYLNAPLPHKPLFPENLRDPTSPKHHIPIAPPYLPLTLLYGPAHKFSSPYW